VLVMYYSEIVDVYEALAGTTKRLEKADILAEFLAKIKGSEKFVYLLRGRVFPDYDESEFGISGKLTIKAIAKASGTSSEKINEKLKKVGDLGDIAEKLFDRKKQSTLFSHKLKTDKVFDNLQKLVEIEGKGSVDRKMNSVIELLTSASGKEAKYIVRTLLNDLRVGVAEGTLREGIRKAFLRAIRKWMM
jgi:DNA ligase 1